MNKKNQLEIIAMAMISSYKMISSYNGNYKNQTGN